MERSVYVAATRAAQAVMQTANPSLIIDGKWGRFTQTVYDSSSSEVKSMVDRSIKAISRVSTSDLAAFRFIEKATGTPMQSDAGSKDMRTLVAEIADLEGVPRETALKICQLESRFDPKAVSPTGFKGLFQLGTPAMTDVYNRDKTGVDWTPAGSNRFGPLFKMTNPFEARQNALVGCRYIKLCAKQMKVSLTDIAPLYMAFNIGVGGARNVLAGNPSAASKEIAANPAYGGGDPTKYYAALVNAVRSA